MFKRTFNIALATDSYSVATLRGSNEKEISHGRVWWQTCWNYLAMGPLASSIG